MGQTTRVTLRTLCADEQGHSILRLCVVHLALLVLDYKDLAILSVGEHHRVYKNLVVWMSFAFNGDVNVDVYVRILEWERQRVNVFLQHLSMGF